MLDILFYPLIAIGRIGLGFLTIAVFVILFAASEFAFRLGRRTADRQEPTESMRSSVGFITGGMLGLFAFLLGISFSLSAARYDLRRQSVLDEANAIGTAWLRAGMVGGQEGADIQRILRDYTTLRIAFVEAATDPALERQIIDRTNTMQTGIWTLAVRVTERAPTAISAIFIASINDMFDLATTARRNFGHGVPPYVLRLVFVVALMSVGAMGYQFGINRNRQPIVSALLLITWTMTMVLVVDIDAPRAGSVRVDPSPLIWTLESWGPPK